MVSNLVICSHPVVVIYCCINNQPKPSICVCRTHQSGNLEGRAGLWGPRRAGPRECHQGKLLCMTSQHCNLGGAGFLMWGSQSSSFEPGDGGRPRHLQPLQIRLILCLCVMRKSEYRPLRLQSWGEGAGESRDHAPGPAISRWDCPVMHTAPLSQPCWV